MLNFGRRTVECTPNSAGSQHPETADAVYNVALACREAGRPGQAGAFFTRCAPLIKPQPEVIGAIMLEGSP